MANLYFTGFEWQSVTAGVEWLTSNSPGAGAFEIDTTVHHSGAASCKFTTSNAASRYMEHLFRATAATTGVYIRFYLYVQQRPDVTVAIFQALNNATSEAAIALRSDGALELFDTDIAGASLGTSGVLSLNTWYMVELFADNGGSPNEVEARLNGSSFATGAASLAGDVDTIYVGAIDWHTSTAAIFNIDDISINDTAGSVNNSWPGEGKIVAALPTAAGDNAATTGLYSYINEVPPSGTATSGSTMIELDSNGVIADYNVTDTATLGIDSYDTITSVQVLARVREEAAGTSSYQLRIKSASGGTVTSTTAADGGNATARTNPASTTAFGRMLISETDPDTATAWTPTGTNSIDNMQIGVTNVDADSTPDLWVLTMAAMIQYVDGTAPGGSAVKDFISMGFIPFAR